MLDEYAIDNGDGTFTDSNGDIVDANGNLINNLNYSTDASGNPVDQNGNILQYDMAGNVVDANGTILEYAPGNETTDSSLAPVAPAMSAALSANGTPAPANSTLSSLANLFHLNIVSPTGINTGSQTGNILAYLQGAIAGQNKTAPAKAAASAFNASTIFSSPIFYIVVILIVGLVIWRIVKR